MSGAGESSTPSIAERLAGIRARIAEAAARAHRDPSSVQLIAVSKLQPIGSIQDALGAGQRTFGENYAQELREKSDRFLEGGAGSPKPEWHFLGALQTNKAKLVAGRAALIHTCDRLSLAEALHKRAAALGVVQRVLIEVNLAAEEQKGGCAPSELKALLASINPLSSLRCEGLMCIPPAGVDPRLHFRELAQLLEQARSGGWSKSPMRELSMGMSADFETAIRFGATSVRVGSALFGSR
jgi:pyridoxal phosphate enzyme (YggS family)